MRLRRFVRWMSRGSTTPSLFASDEGGEWVVKPTGATFRDGLVELLSSRLAEQMGLATPASGVFQAGTGLLSAMTIVDDDLRALADAFRRGGALAYGSRLCPGVDWVPSAHVAAEERETLGHIWIFDQWIANADRRPDNPNLILSERRLLVIDHAQGLPWLTGDNPRPAPHVRTALGDEPHVARGEARGRAALRAFTDETDVRAAFGDIPDAWAHADELDALAEVLAVRARSIREEGPS